MMNDPILKHCEEHAPKLYKNIQEYGEKLRSMKELEALKLRLSIVEKEVEAKVSPLEKELREVKDNYQVLGVIIAIAVLFKAYSEQYLF